MSILERILMYGIIVWVTATLSISVARGITERVDAIAHCVAMDDQCPRH